VNEVEALPLHALAMQKDVAVTEEVRHVPRQDIPTRTKLLLKVPTPLQTPFRVVIIEGPEKYL
jgi:hypothetical protein